MKSTASFLRLGALALAATSIVSAQQVVRGPYLQIGTPNSVVVRWRTDVPTDSAVRFGSDAGALNREVKTKWKTTEHIVALEGLAPSTKYFYSIDTDDQMQVLGGLTLEDLVVACGG